MGFRVAILGCGTVGGGVARILLEQTDALRARAGCDIELAGIVDLFPDQSSDRHGVPRELYAGEGTELTTAEADAETDRVLEDSGIDLVVETIGGSDEAILRTACSVLEHGKHLVTANKALLAHHGNALRAAAREHGRRLGSEAAVCARCGAPAEPRCSDCGRVLPEAAAFCPGCGRAVETRADIVADAPVGADGERKRRSLYGSSRKKLTPAAREAAAGTIDRP